MSENEITEQKPNWKESRKKQLYAELVKSAVKLFGENGFDGPSVDDIVTATGVAKGTFYLYFKSKSDIIQAVINSGLKELEQHLSTAISNPPEQAPDALIKVAQAVLQFFEENPTMIGILMSAQGISSNQLPVETRNELRKKYRTVTTGAYERIIRKGMLQGHFRETDAHTAAIALSGILSGLVFDAIDIGHGFTDIAAVAVELIDKGITRRG